jgi:mannitol/fructose-specific phosphotransferase system IIA component (Ntr-type)
MSKTKSFMVITKFIPKNCIIPELEAKTKAAAVRELTHRLYDKKKIPDVALALDQIVAREATESTGIGNGIAVPHARIPGMKSLACAVGRVTEGLDFMAVDRKPVKLIFLICYPPSQQTTYLNFVATIARLLSDKEHFQALVKAEDTDALYAALEDICESFDVHQEKKISAVTKSSPKLEQIQDGHADLLLLARLLLHLEMLAAARSGKKRIQERIDGIRALVDPRVLRHFDKLQKSRAPALVPVEGDTCQGCFMRLPSKFVQQVRRDTDHIHTCSNCSRYIYVV